MIPAAWFDDPGDPRQIRYWDGSTWTNTVAPKPAPTFTPPTPPVPIVTTPHSRPDPYAGAQSGQSSYGFAQHAQNPYQNLPTQFQTPEVYQAAQTVGRAAGIGGAISGIIFGLVFIAISTFIFQMVDSSTATPAGATTIAGRVTSLDMNNGMCSPVAGFVVDGEPHSARSNTSQQPCPWSVGDPVDVSYTPGSVDATARVQEPLSPIVTIMRFVFIGAGLLVIGLSIRRLVYGIRGR
jgi:hypothetical protein